MITTGNNFKSIYQDILEYMSDHAILYGKTKMIEDLHFTLTQPQHSLIPIKKNWAWALHEGINRLSFEDKTLQNPGTAYIYRPNWKKKLVKEGGKFCYSYGDWYFLQIPQVLKKLKSKSEREAIISVWNQSYLFGGFERTPCTLFLHFYFFQNKLNCHCSMRTSDVMNLLPYDVFHHTLLQRYIATVLNVELGSFHFTSSFAYYQKKRDITFSVRNTIFKLEESGPINYSNNWRFYEEDRKILMSMTKRIYEKYKIETIFTDYDKERLSDFGLRYVKALLYYYDKKTNLDINNELGVVYL